MGGPDEREPSLRDAGEPSLRDAIGDDDRAGRGVGAVHSSRVALPGQADDSRAFTVGMWIAESLLFTAALLGFAVFRGASDAVAVGTAFAGLLWVVAFLAVYYRGVLRPKPSARVRVVAVGAGVLFAAWIAAAIVIVPGGGLGDRLVVVGFGVACHVAFLRAAFLARMFHWR